MGSMVLRGYSPLVGLVVILAMLVAFVPSKSPRAILGGGAGSGAGSGSAAGPSGSAGEGTAPAGAAKGSACEGGARQTVEPYSPPCLTFSGDNGGATSKGVTAKEVGVAYREGNLPSLFAVAGKVAKRANIQDSPEDVRRTIEAYFDYFNQKFELYGRKAKVSFYKGVGDQLSEFFGAGAEAAGADALKVGQEMKAFADLSVLTAPYAEALVRQKVVAIPPIHMSQQWYDRQAPYAWGVFVDCTRLADTIVDYGMKRGLGKPAAFAGDPELRTKPRTLGVIAPEQPWYQECLNGAEQKLNKAGFKFTHRINYRLDFSRLATDAPGMIAQMKAKGVTTVVCACDPILPIFLTGQATQQGYKPEWFVAATALTDVDLLGQIYDQEQWSHAGGVSFLGDIYQGPKAESYRAYKAVRKDEPAFIHDVLYYPVLLFFLGLHMAGPNLTPESFRDGLFNYPATLGETGTWSFGPGDYTATDDAREIYFDPDAVSPFNNAKGRYVTTLEGKRFFGDGWPQGQPAFPVRN